MSEPVEWDCEGCGLHVIGFGMAAKPRHGLCALCAWLCEHVPDPDEMMRTRRALDLPHRTAEGG